jgi:hypothetical protein
MSLSPTFGPCAPGPSPTLRHAGGIGCLVSQFIEVRVLRPLSLWSARQAIRTELKGLDYRELRDLGISEHAIDGFVDTWSPPRTY